MKERFVRSSMLLGVEQTQALADKKVAIFGVGGVGGYVAEALARTGIGKFDLVDHDTVSVTNINRQIIALTETIGRKKVHVMKERILSINPEAEVEIHDCFFLPETAQGFRFEEYDYVVDAVDTVTAKLEIIECAKKAGVMVISCMGAGNKLDPTKFEVTDISKTSVCPLAKVMRRELKKRGVTGVKVVYSKEEALVPLFYPQDISGTDKGIAENTEETAGTRKKTPGSVAFVPSVAGLIAASEVVRDLTCQVSVKD